MGVTDSQQAMHAVRATTCGHGIPHNVCKSKHEVEESAT